MHGHGTRLYLDVASLMDYAARETVRRLCYCDDARRHHSMQEKVAMVVVTLGLMPLLTLTQVMWGTI